MRRLLTPLLLVSLFATPATATVPGDDGRISYIKGCCDQYELWVTGADLATLDEILDPFLFEFISGPSWSSEGWLLFGARSTFGNGSTEIWKTEGDGTDVIQVTHTRRWEWDPSLSPDGTQIAYSASGGDLFLMDISGANRRRLTTTHRYEWSPEWSPDGTQLVFMRDGRRSTEMYLIDVASGLQTRLTRNRSDEYHAKWTPDGSALVYSRRTGRPGSWDEVGVWKMDIASKQATALIDEPDVRERAGAVSPDGTRLVWIKELPATDPYSLPESELVVSDLDGANAIVVDHCTWECTFYGPDWESVPTPP